MLFVGTEKSEELLRAVLTYLDDKKALNLKVFSLLGASILTDYVVIVSGTSGRHCQSMGQNLINYLKDNFKHLYFKRSRIEGFNDGNWLIVDLGDVVVHLFREEVRQYYNLDEHFNEFQMTDPAKPHSVPLEFSFEK